MQPIRQGDVILIPVSTHQAAGNLVSHLTLAAGEVTGHRHRISSGQAELREADDGELYLQVLSEIATLTHEEHQSIAIPKGTWEVRTQREYDPFDEWRYVED